MSVISVPKDYVCLDLETTGLDPKSDRIIEIAMVRVRNGEIAERYSALINPRQELEEKTIELTGISPEWLKDKPTLEEELPKIAEFLQEDILLGHRILFDYSFLKRAFTNHKIPFERKGIDTLYLARALVKDCEKKSLPALCEHYGILYQAHRALSDAEATIRLYEILCTLGEDPALFVPRQLNYKVKKESPITRAQKERLEKMIEYYHLSPPWEISSLTRNEASRHIDRILSAYGRLPADVFREKS